MRGRKPEKTSRSGQPKLAKQAKKTIKTGQVRQTGQDSPDRQDLQNGLAGTASDKPVSARTAAINNGCRTDEFTYDHDADIKQSAGEIQKKSTGDLLLEYAGQLFAEHGYSGTSIKMIADASKQNIAAVNYHFGTKQNLFICALKHVLSHIMQPVKTETGDSKEVLAVLLRIFIHDRCMFLLSGKAPAWYGKLIVRAGFEIPFAEDQKTIEVFKPDFEFLENLAGRIKKGVEPMQARWWAYSVVGQIFFYVFGRDMIKIANPDTCFDIRTVNAISEHIYELSLEWLMHEQPPKPLRKTLNRKKPGKTS